MPEPQLQPNNPDEHYFCASCNTENPIKAPYCSHCGLQQGSLRHAAILQDNCWQARDDEFAVYFGMAQLQGVFRKALQVPIGTRAWVVQAGQSSEVPPGEYELESFFARLNNLLRDQRADILIAKSAPFSIAFSFSDLQTAEFLPLAIELTLNFKIDNLAAFARYFMSVPGVVTRQDLHSLLSNPLRQVLAEFIAAQALPEMASNRQLRLQLDEHLHSMLKLSIGQFGIALVQVDGLQLQHDKFDAQRHAQGSLLLVLDEKRQQLQHSKQFYELYDAQEWQRIQREREQIERDLQEQQLRQQASNDANNLQQELSLQQQERLQTLRARKIELFGRIAQADNEQQALKLGAQESLRALQHEMAGKAVLRLDTVRGWQQMRALAGIKMQAELELAQQEARENLALMRQRFAMQIASLQRQQHLARIAEIADAKAHHRAEQRAAQAEQQVQLCEQQWQAQRLQAKQALMQLQIETRQHEARRTQQWQEQLQWQKERELLRNDEVQNSQVQHDKLRSTLALQAQFNEQQIKLEQQRRLAELDAQERTMQIRQSEEAQQWQRRQESDTRSQEARFAQWQHEQAQALELARLEMTRLGVVANMSDMGKLALANPANASLLAEVMKTQIHASMQAEQIAASVGSINAVQMQEKISEERQYREALAEKERAQQLALLGLVAGQMPTKGRGKS